MTTKRPTMTQQLEEARAEIAQHRRQHQLTTDTIAALSETVTRIEDMAKEAQAWSTQVSGRAAAVHRENDELRESNLQLRRENDRLRMRRGPVGAFWDFVMGPPRA